MKNPVVLTICILLLGSAPGWFLRQRAALLREDHRKLVEDAARLGLAVESGAAGDRAGAAKRPRLVGGDASPGVTGDLVRFGIELEEWRLSGKAPDEAFREHTMEIMARLMELDDASLKHAVASLRESPELSETARGNAVSYAIRIAAIHQPESAVALFTESSEMIARSSISDHAITCALNEWAEKDPLAALEWIQANGEKFPLLAGGEGAKRGWLAGAAVHDPQLAFAHLEDLFGDPVSGVSAILVSGAGGDSQRTAMLGALRGYLAGIEDETRRQAVCREAMEVLARSAETEGFEATASWISSAGLTDEETRDFAGGLGYFTTQEDTGRWVEWLSGKLPAERVAGQVRSMVAEWTQQDYVAAGTWLSETSDGPAKAAAVEAYAEAVAAYEPQIAAQWALTLAPGPARQATLKAVYQNWPGDDPEGAAAFASQHGLD